jgi:hypothetical protein
MSDEQQSGQAQTPDRQTLGNAITDYPNAPTIKAPRNGHLPEIALQGVLGGYPMERLTTELTSSVKGSGGRYACHAVLMYFLACYNVRNRTAFVSDVTIATDLGMDRATVNKCKRVLIKADLMQETDQVRGKGCKVYSFQWFEQNQNEPVAVLNSTHIQHITNTTHVQHTTPQAKPKPKTTDPFLDRWELLIADLPNEMKSGLNYKQARPMFLACLANGWDKYPEQLKSAVMYRIEPGHTEPGKLVNVLKELANIKPPKPIAKCGIHNCNGNQHEDPETRDPYDCPNKSPNF